MAFWTELNLSIFHAINGFCGRSVSLDRLVSNLDAFGLKGIAISGVFGVLWFKPGEDQARRHEVLVATLVAMSLTILAIRGISLLAPYEVRPMFTPDIGYRAPLYKFMPTQEDWSCFPSDQAGMMFSLTVGCWFASRLAASLMTIFSIVSMLARVYVGGHYPGDVLIGALVGIGITIALNMEPLRAFIAAPFLAIERRAPALFYGVLLAALFEAGVMFSTVRSVGKAIIHLYSGAYS
jgi:membrane-associated phospholipid phosphatase